MHSPALPLPRGPLTAFLAEHLARPVHTLPPSPAPASTEDAQLALYLCYELHYRGLAGVASEWEWAPSLIALRHRLEQEFEADLRRAVGPVDRPTDVAAALQELVAGGDGPSLSGWLLERGSLAHIREFAIHRSAYQLKEADPHTWALPRLSGLAKSAMVEIQTDEYGHGRPGQSHAELFADTMQALDLDPTYGAYLERIPAATLATVNLVSMLGLHRRLRGALVGHLAVFEMTSVGPMGRYSRTLERLGVGPRGRRFFDVHVEADVTHQVIAAHQLAGGLVSAEPGLAADVMFGARAVSEVEAAFTRHLLGSWEKGDSSLLDPARPAQAA